MHGRIFDVEQTKAPVYQFVFQTGWLKVVIFVMVAFFILHPAMPAFAGETASSTTAIEAPTATEDATEPTEATATEEESALETTTSKPAADESSETPGSETVDAAATTHAGGADAALATADTEDTEESAGEGQTTAEATTTTETVAPYSETVASHAATSATNTTAAPEITEDGPEADTATSTIPDTDVQAGEEAATTTSSTTAATNASQSTEDTGSATSDNETVSTTTATSAPATTENTETNTAPVNAGDGAETVSEVTENTTSTESAGVDSVDDQQRDDNPAEQGVAEQASSTESQAASTSTTALEDEPAAGVQSAERGELEFVPSECVAVADGSYYCSKQKESVVPEGEDIDWTVKALADADGDTEIYFYNGDELQQITSNLYDDAAPHYDAASHSIVWHRLVNDRYQIMSHDLTLRETTQLTQGSTNNMEPSRYGDYTVWQRWVDNNWEVMLLEDGVEQQISNNTYHDTLPDVQEGYIIWNSHTVDSEPQVMMYELTSGTRATIADTDGGQVVNPRFVLVYDTEFANGDLVTKGFDPESGSVITLAAQPADTPPEIPESDQTGETRALIQNKPAREVQEEELAVTSQGSSTTDTATTSAAITASSSDSVATTTVDMTPATSTMPLSDYDLPVTPYEPATTTDEAVSTTSAPTQ